VELKEHQAALAARDSSFGTSIMQKTPGYSKDGPESLGQVAA
jgi:hypothetical protein